MRAFVACNHGNYGDYGNHGNFGSALALPPILLNTNY